MRQKKPPGLCMTQAERLREFEFFGLWVSENVANCRGAGGVSGFQFALICFAHTALMILEGAEKAVGAWPEKCRSTV